MIEFRLDPETYEPLIASLRPVLEQLKEELAGPATPPDGDDEMIAEFWERDLLESQRLDLEKVASLFEGDFSNTGIVIVTDEDSDLVLRGCTALRLRIRETMLRDVDDGALEAGELSRKELNVQERLGYAVYVLLASLQEVIISQAHG